jgi:integrase
MAKRVYGVDEATLNLPGAHDRDKPRGALHAIYPGLWWRTTVEGPVVWERNPPRDKRTGRRPPPERLEGARTWQEAVDLYLERKTKPAEAVLLRGDVKVTDVSTAWLATYELKVERKRAKRKSLKTYGDHVRLHIDPWFGKTLIKDVDEDTLHAFFAHLTTEKGLAEQTQCGIMGVLGHLVRHARTKRWISGNPFDLCNADLLPQQQPGKPGRVLREHEVERLLANISLLHHDAVEVLAYTGMRINELTGLKWRDVSLADPTARAYLRVVSQLDRVDGEYVQAELGPKGRATATTNHSVRKIVLFDRARDALLRQLKREIDKGFGNDDDWVFTTSPYHGGTASGLPVLASNLRRSVYLAAKRAGLEHVKPHDLRHSAASTLAAAGVPVNQAAAFLGHTPKTYYQTYVKPFEDERELLDTAERVEAFGWGQAA